MANRRSVFRIVCTPADYDNMGEILKDMGYRYREYGIKDLNAKEAMQNVDILFINCQGIEPTWEASNNIRELVSRGGALYISCYARKWLDFIFPEKIEFHNKGEIQGKLYTRIIDEGLMEYLGVNELYLNYNTHWHGIEKIKATTGPEAVQVYMKGKRQGSPWDEEDLLVSFKYDEGFVIFTTFHNSHQVSALEQRLLQYLVLKPLMAGKSNESHTILVQKAFTQAKEVIGALSPGDQSPLYEYETFRPYDLKFVFNWEGKAIARVFVIDPLGKTVVEENIRTSPYELDLSQARPGKWKFKLKIVDAPMKNFPYIINVGVKEAVEKNVATQAADKSFIQKESLQAIFSKDNLPSIGESMDEQNQISAGNKRTISRSIKIEILEPIRQLVGEFDLEVGKKIGFGQDELPANVPGREYVNLQQVVIQLLDLDQLIIRDVSDSGTEAVNYVGGDLPETVPLTKNIPVAYKFPLLLKFAGRIIIGFF
jgi:hypothetical protein